MQLYKSEALPRKDRLRYDGEKLFLRQVEASFDGHQVGVDEHKDIPMLIEKHTNPLNKNLHDMKAKYLDSTGDFMHIGNLVTLSTGKTYMAVTDPSSNGIYSEYKILPLNDDVKFRDVKMKCVIANKGFYDESSYTNETTVFEDKELRATILQYNQDTKNLSLFDNIYVNDDHYKIVKIDNHTFKAYDEAFGVLQLVLIDTPFGTIRKNLTDTFIEGVIMSARVKDKILNSIARELICNYNQVQRGDFITFTYDRDEKGTMVDETYLTINKPTMGEGYDKSLLYLCESAMNLLSDNGKVVTVPLYFENNRTRIDKVTEDAYKKLKESSYLVMTQNNDLTKKLINKVKRVLVNGHAYEITGFDDFSNGVLGLGLELDQITDDDNESLGVANYKSQMKELGSSQVETSQIVELNGRDALCKGYSNTYSLQGEVQGVEWIVDVDWMKMTQSDGTCQLIFNNLKYVNKTAILSAIYNGVTHTKTIKTTKL